MIWHSLFTLSSKWEVVREEFWRSFEVIVRIERWSRLLYVCLYVACDLCMTNDWHLLWPGDAYDLFDHFYALLGLLYWVHSVLDCGHVHCTCGTAVRPQARHHLGAGVLWYLLECLHVPPCTQTGTVGGKTQSVAVLLQLVVCYFGEGIWRAATGAEPPLPVQPRCALQMIQKLHFLILTLLIIINNYQYLFVFLCGMHLVCRKQVKSI